MKNLAESLGTFGYFVYLCNGFVVKLPKIRNKNGQKISFQVILQQSFVGAVTKSMYGH